MATVYLCFDSVRLQRVAVKVLRGELGSAVIFERFQREIEFASELEHPQVPKVLDSGETNGLPFYVMTYVEGESLRERLDRVKQLPVEEAVRIGLAVMDPMTYAHRLGIVHRDIKPGNILIGADTVYVLDFGIARAIVASAEERLTSTGMALGTPAYMSPEQALADKDLDARSDIYSLGCVIYEMIAGIPPFVGATPQSVMARRFAAPAPPLSETRDGVPAYVEHAVAKALSRAPADRWQTAHDFARALSSPRASDSIQHVSKVLQVRRSRYAAAIAAVIGVAIMSVFGWAWAGQSRDPVTAALHQSSEWDFEAARATLEKASSKKNADPNTKLWLAQIRMIRGDSPSDWRSLLNEARDPSSVLETDDSLRLDGLAAFARADFSTACRAFGELRSPQRTAVRWEIVTTLAFADCLLADQTIVRDSSSPSGYAFATSHHMVDSIYESLLDRNASEEGAYKQVVPRLDRVLSIDKRMLRRGKLDGVGLFYAQPSLVSDTLAYVPYPLTRSGAPLDLGAEERLEAAITRNRDRLLRRADEWVRRAPADPDAHESLAKYLAASGQLDGGPRSALSELIVARGLASKIADTTAASLIRRLRLANSEIGVLVRLGQYGRIGAIADSALAVVVDQKLDDVSRNAAEDFQWRLAALRGRVQKVIEIEQRYAPLYEVMLPSGIERPPLAISRDAIALANYAAFGAPADSILTVWRRLERMLPSLVPPSKLEEWRVALLRRPLTLAAPVIGAQPVASLGPTADPVASILVSYARGDTRSARRQLASLRTLHADKAPGEITMDVTYQEAWLSALLGDTTYAATLLENALNGTLKAPPSMLDTPLSTAAWIRAAIFASQLAAKRQDTDEATTWAAAPVELWSKGSPELSYLVTRLKQQ